MLEFVRRLRHGPLRKWSPMWLCLGRIYRLMISVSGMVAGVDMHVGKYGPFKFDPRFAFSDFSSFGHGKNAGLPFCVEAVANANCVLDIGAHIGLVSLPVSKVLAPGGRLFAFEPGEVNRKYHQKHMDLNNISNVSVLGLVVSDEKLDEVEFYEQTGDSPMNSLAIRSEGGHYNSVVKQQTSLDSFCSENDLSPDVIKIDVEGAEIKVLRGAIETLRKCKPVIFLSVHKEEIREIGGSLNELTDLIHNMDYELFDFDNKVVCDLNTDEYLMKPQPSN